MTIDSIVAEVTKELSDTLGSERVANMDQLVARLNGVEEALLQERARLRVRPGISFSVNTTHAKTQRLTLSVRVEGVECGLISFASAERMFRPSKTFKERHWRSREGALEWGERAVAEFLSACAHDARVRFAQRESSVQELLFRAMKGTGGIKTGHLRGFQPVRFGGVPIQIPSPVAPRRASAEAGKHMGHSDVLARSRQHGRLVVFEVKRPGAARADCVGALAQGVRYAAALDHLMSRDRQRASYWRLFGSRRGERHKPTFSVVAFLNAERAAAYEIDLRAARAQLLGDNVRMYDLSVMLYRKTSTGLQVARVIEGAA